MAPFLAVEAVIEGSGITGTVTVQPYGEETMFDFELFGLMPEANYEIAFHQGTCEPQQFGFLVEDLRVSAILDPDGALRLRLWITSDLEGELTPFEYFADGAHIIAVTLLKPEPLPSSTPTATEEPPVLPSATPTFAGEAGAATVTPVLAPPEVGTGPGKSSAAVWLLLLTGAAAGVLLLGAGAALRMRASRL